MDAYVLWRVHPFPRGGSGNDLPEIHGDLAMADEYVAAVIRFVEQGIFKPVVPDVLERIDAVIERTEQFLDDSDAEVRAIAREQHAYAALIRFLYAEFLKEGIGGR